jgi:ATP-binding cassette subfamily B protein
MAFPIYRQYDAMDCGPTCLRMIAKHYGKEISAQQLRSLSCIDRSGVSMLGISQAAEAIGFKAIASKVSFEQLNELATLPCVLHWKQNHFVVLPPQNYDQKKNQKILIADPARGLIRVDKKTFLESWQSRDGSGLVLELETTDAFDKDEIQSKQPSKWSSLFFYIGQHRKYFLQILVGIIAGMLLQIAFPFLTQSIVDKGINNANKNFISIILYAQAMMLFARTAIEFIRNRLLLFISARVNISLLTGLWCKLLKLPLSYFDTRHVGDIQQRLQDQKQIESFLTGGSLTLLFAAVNLFAFSLVLLLFSPVIFSIFVICSLAYFGWARMFLQKRRDINYQRFALLSQEQTASLQMIQGMQEIRLNDAGNFFRWDWERIQAKLFKLKMKSLSASQLLQAGALFLNEGKNIFITYYVATLVLDGNLSIGAMLAIQYIVGQLNGPIEQIAAFNEQLQDTKIALERSDEIHQTENEENTGNLINLLPIDKSIHLKNLSFSYTSASSQPVLKNVDLVIPEGKTTAIVGMSGSGKTTLLRLILKIHENYEGNIFIGESNESDERFRNSKGRDLKQLGHSFWRKKCGCVLQDGYIFNTTIAGNIAVGDETYDEERLRYACEVAQILSFVESLPLGFNTKIGQEGIGLSQGQRQRILIARAVYPDPDYVFLDEATNALDANNERAIMKNLNSFLKGKTVIIVAHRLSTVMNADKVVVLRDGCIVEEGHHRVLAEKKGHYFELVKNQLELGN